MAQEADISLDVYCSSHKVQEELQGRLQAAPLEGVHLRWQPAGFAPEHGTSSSGAVDQGGNAESDQAQSSFDGPRYMAVLKRGGRMGQALVTAQEMTSTQEFMRANLAGFGDGVVLVADRQTAGKGRGGNVWTSPAGCLMFSCSRQLGVLPNQAPFINYVVCLGVVKGIQDAVRDCCGPDAPQLPIAIKWPNDIYYLPPKDLVGSSPTGPATSSSSQGTSTSAPGADSCRDSAATDGASVGSRAAPPSTGPQKIGGALIHTTWSRDRFNLVTGIGLNLSNAHPTTCLNAILKSSYEQGRGISFQDSKGTDGGHEPLQLPQEVVLAHIMNRLDECFQDFEELGFGPLEADYLASWMHSGQQLQFLEHGEHSLPGYTEPLRHHQDLSSGTSLASLTIQGLSPTGFLMATEESTGRRFELTPDGNSLDMMAGLIRRKLPN